MKDDSGLSNLDAGAADQADMSRPPDQLLVCVGSRVDCEHVIRAAKELATTLKSDWIAIHVETPAPLRSNTDRRSVAHNMALAERLGAETVRLVGLDAAEEVLRYARERGVDKVVVGRPPGRRFLANLRRNFLLRLVSRSRGLAVHVVSGEPGLTSVTSHAAARAWDWRAFSYSLVAVLLSTVLSAVIFGRDNLSDVIIIYVSCVVFVSLRYGYGAALLATALSALSLDFIFVKPYLSFSVADPRDALTVVVMFVGALIISSLTKRVRDQSNMARQREAITSMLYAMSRELAGTLGIDTMLRVTIRHLHDAFDAKIAVLLPDASNELKSIAVGPRSFEIDAADREIAAYVWQNQQSAGARTENFPSSSALFLLLRGSRGKVGILAVKPSGRQAADSGQLQLLRTFAAQVGSALERGQLAEAAQRAQVEIETERMRSSLLSSVSHDLRTPLGVITGAISTLLQDERYLDTEAKRELLDSAHEEAERLNRLVGNLLDMTRLASGALRPKKEWHPLDELVGVALNRLEARLQAREVTVNLPSELPPLPIDAVLVEQVLINLIENAIKYTPLGSPIELSAVAISGGVEISVSDRGPGIPLAQRGQIFEKFQRLKPDASDGGTGLGLAICRGIVEAHGGHIGVDDRAGGGAVFRFVIPIDGVPPAMGGAWQHE
jgi:two-component system sensor histidine kinase KdpD